MKLNTLIVLGILFLVVCGCLSHTLLESFRGRGGRRGGGRGGGGRGGGGRGGGGRGGGWRGGRGGGGRGGGYLHRFRRRGYGGWNRMPAIWGNMWPSLWSAPCNCKRGCTPDGCAFPGTGPDDCVWAADCNCCGTNYYT